MSTPRRLAAPAGRAIRDAALVERLRRHEEGAAEALVAAYGNRVYRLAIRITGNSSDAEEVVQDALWAATRKIDTFRGTAAFGSWIYRITANAAYQKRRKRRVERDEVSWDDLAPSFDETGQHVQPGVDWSPRLKDPALQAELHSVLGAAIEGCRRSTARSCSCTTSRGSRAPRSPRRCRSSWARSSRGCTELGSFCEAAWPTTWRGGSRPTEEMSLHRGRRRPSRRQRRLDADREIEHAPSRGLLANSLLAWPMERDRSGSSFVTRRLCQRPPR